MPLLLSYHDLRAAGLKLSRTQIWRLEKSSQFPKRINVSPGRVAWLASEFYAWIVQRANARQALAA